MPECRQPRSGHRREPMKCRRLLARSFLMPYSPFRRLAIVLPAALFASRRFRRFAAGAQSSSSNSQADRQSSSSQPVQEKAPSLVDPAGPTISLVSSEPVFLMAAALNACGYDEGLDESAPVRKRVRDEINDALAKSEDARAKRDKVCLYIAQHRLTGSEHDISQYISLALYLSPPPALETTVELTEMPPDSTQVVEIVPLLRDFVQAVDLHGIWLAVHHTYDEETDRLHDPLSKMIVSTNLYLKMPATTYEGRRFVVVIEPQLSPKLVNARIYGTDYVVVVSPVNGTIPMNDVRHTYLHYIIEPLLYSRSNAIDRMQPILKEVRDAPLEFRYRSDTVALMVECLIKAIEARTMDTGIPEYKIPAGVERSDLPRYEHERQVTQQKMEAVRVAAVHHDMTQGFVLTQYFFEQLIQFEKDPASLRDTIGEMVYGMDIDQQVHRARQTEFDKQADGDVLQRSKPRVLTGLDLAEAKLAQGDVATAERHGAQGAGRSLRHAGFRGAGGARELHPGARGHRDRPSRRGHRRLPEDDCDQQGSAAAGVVAHLPGPHAGSGLQARPGCYGVPGSAGGARRAAGYAAGSRARREDGVRGEGPQLRRGCG